MTKQYFKTKYSSFRAQDNICNINKYAQRPILECREGSTCIGPDFEEEEEGDEEATSEADEEFFIGDEKECGTIVHYGDKCIDMDDTADMKVVLDSMCDRYMCLTTLGYLQDKASKLCITTDDHKSPEDNEALHFAKCTASSAIWTRSDNGFKHFHTGKCWHPLGGDANPEEGTGIVVFEGCDEARLEFEFEEETCWEEESGVKLGKKLKDDDGKKYKFKTLTPAKDMCMDIEECKGIYYQAKNKKYLLSKSDKTMKSTTADKAWIQVECGQACAAGTQRCGDGECKEQCTEEDTDCPAGTVRCADGICKHEHMCHM